VLFVAYNLLTTLALPLAALYHLYRSGSRGRKPAFAERFGLQPAACFAPLAGETPVFWVHAVSVGEAIAAKPLLTGLKEASPGCRIVMSTGTETGRGVADTLPTVDLALYFPFFDCWWAVERLYDRIGPLAVIVMETEIWPNFLRAANKRGIPVLVANGRISDRSIGRYLRFRWFFARVLPLVDRFCMQSAADAARIVAIGAPEQRVVVGNNLKYDVPLQTVSVAERNDRRRAWHIAPDARLLVAGSTHAGEEEQVVSAYGQLLPRLPDLRLIMVPRHPERAAEVAAVLQRAGYDVLLSSQLPATAEPIAATTVLLVDQVGRLMDLYRIADLVFVGGSLVPHGGHNILEPAACGVPVLHGPHMHNFREIAGLFAEHRAALMVQDAGALVDAIAGLCADTAAARALGASGASVVAANGGATTRHLAALAELLSRRTAAVGGQRPAVS
jgi:3-deoxy-D-manno-octulosonic-acid transferase